MPHQVFRTYWPMASATSFLAVPPSPSSTTVIRGGATARAVEQAA
jgi:hypothetical protein